MSEGRSDACDRERCPVMEVALASSAFDGTCSMHMQKEEFRRCGRPDVDPILHAQHPGDAQVRCKGNAGLYD